MSNEPKERFQFINEKRNPRSITGLLRCNGDAKVLSHYKRANPTTLEREMHELQRAEAVTRGIEGVYPIRVRTYLPEEGLLVTEYVQYGESLFNYLWNSSSWWNLRGFSYLSPAEICTCLGRWLRVYHASTLSTTGHIEPILQWIAESTRGKLRRLNTGAPGYLPSRTVEKIQKYVESAISSSTSWGMRYTTQIHGDMELSNSLITPRGTLYITDFADTREGLPWEDLVRCWHAIWTLSQLTPRHFHLLQPCLHILIAEYGESESILQSPLFTFLRCWNAVCNILTVITVRKRVGFSARRAGYQLARANKDWLISVKW
jgi:hypothetical protein